MSASVFIVRGVEKFAVNCASVLEAFNGHFKVKFTDVLCPNCGVAATSWIPVERVEPKAAPADCPANVPPPADELGISPVPWKPADDGMGYNDIWCNKPVTEDSEGEGIIAELVDAKDANMMSTAPKLYDGLREAVIESCHNCPYCGGYPDYACRGEKGSCFVQCWRATLAEAAGMKWGTK